jgi:hypothetical protein
VSTPTDNFRNKYFMSLAPVYLITSGYLMQAALKNPSGVVYGLSVFFMASTIWLVVAAFIKLPRVALDYTYEIFAALALVSALVFVIGWLNVLTGLLNLKASPSYVYAYFFVGLLLYFAILGFNVYNAFKRAR